MFRKESRMDDFETEIKKDFISEGLLNLEETEASFMELESSSDPKPLLEKIFRMAHNLKGGSRAVGFGHIAEFTHQLENLVLKIQKNEIALSSDLITTLLNSNDRISQMLKVLKSDLNASFENSDLINELQAWVSGQRKIEVPESSVAEALKEIPADTSLVSLLNAELPLAVAPIESSSIEQEMAQMLQSHQPEAQAQAELNPAVNLVSTPKAPEAVSSEKKIAEKEDEVIRVNLSRIDSLNNFVGEMIVQLSVLQQQAVQNAAAPLISSLRQMNKLSKEIQDLSMSLQLPARREFWKLQDGLELFLRAQFPLSLACSNQRALSQRVPFR